MKEISLPVNELKMALPGLNKIISRHQTLPVLGCIKVECGSTGAITLAANNLDQAAVCSLDSDGKGEACAILVPLKDLSNIVKKCSKNDTIALRNGEEASVLSGTIQYPVGSTTVEHRFDLIPVEEFPPIPQIEGDPVPMPDALRSSLLEAFQCASDDETRYILNGAYLDVSKPECHQVVGTNGRILYASNSFSIGLEKSLVIPTNRFLQWKPFMEDGNWNISVGQGSKDAPGALQISSLRWRFISRQIEGQFPDYQQVIPTADQYKRKLVLDPATLLEVIQTIERMPCHNQVDRTIGLQLRDRSVFLLGKSNAEQPWSAFEIKGAKTTGKDVLIAFNRDYLTRALSFGLNTVQIIDEMSPARFSNGGRQMIVMPLRADGPPPQTTATVPEDTETAPADAVASPTASTTPEEAQPNERNNMQTIQAAPPASNGSKGHNPETTPLEAALVQIESIKGSCKDSIRKLNGLADVIKQAQRDQRTSERDVESVRTALGKLQSVRL